MTEKKKHFVSLSVKPLFVLLLGLVLGVCVCLLANFTGEQIIERSYMSDKAVLKRTNRAAQEFQSFVRQNSISTRDTDMLARWGESRKNYYIMLYHDQRQILEIGWWGADSAAVDAYSLKEQMASVVYPIVFRDGTFYAVIYDNSDSGLYDLLWIVSLLLGCAVLALTLLAYNRRVARRVVAISQEVQSIGAGNLYLQLEPKGRDEISQLTASVEQMRLSLLRKTSEEQRALQQNSDLITAMSHDIRNPLTALLGYLDLAKNGQYRSEDELQSYLDAAYGKAEQLKTLTDEQFACGMGEILKHGLIKDQGYYEWTICHRQEIMERSLEVLEEMISRSCEIKRDVVEKDPTEKGDRALLNFGHTLGHAIEKLKNFSLMHGQCVALGSLAASYLSMRRGQITEAELTAIKEANIAFGLPVSVEGVTPEEVVATTRSDKKMEAGKVKFILLNSIGDACIDRSVTDQEMEDAVKYLENITLL